MNFTVGGRFLNLVLTALAILSIATVSHASIFGDHHINQITLDNQTEDTITLINRSQSNKCTIFSNAYPFPNSVPPHTATAMIHFSSYQAAFYGCSYEDTQVIFEFHLPSTQPELLGLQDSNAGLRFFFPREGYTLVGPEILPNDVWSYHLVVNPNSNSDSDDEHGSDAD